MGITLIHVCSRCGQRHKGTEDKPESGWFTNNFGDQCHFCPDGVVGGLAEVESGAAIPSLSTGAEFIDADVNCHICGGVLSLVTDESIHPHRGSVGMGDYQLCPSCLVARRVKPGGVRDRGRYPWFLLEIEPYLPGGDFEEVAAYQLAWVKSLNGSPESLVKLPAALGMNQGAMNQILGIHGKRKSLDLPCGDCGADTEKLYAFTDNNPGAVIEPLACRGIEVVDAHVSLAVNCPRCRRMDYYLYNDRRDKWTWAGHFPGGRDGHKGLRRAAIDGTSFAQLTGAQLEKLKQERPVSVTECDEFAVTPTEETAIIVKHLSEAMEKTTP